MYRSRAAEVMAFAILTVPLVCHAQGGIISTVAGSSTGAFGFSGDGGPATSALLRSPQGVAVDGAGNVYIVDTQNQRVRKVNTAGIISTLAGNGTLGFSGDGNPATSAMLNMPGRVAVDGSGNVYFSVAGRIRKVNGAGTISTVAGMGTAGFVGDGGPATSAGLSLGGLGIAVDGAGNLYIADTAFQRVRKVDTSGIIRTIAGTGAAGYSGDGGPATSATFNDPQALAVDNAGNLYIVDNRNNCVRKVNPSGIISTVAGTGTAGYSGDGGPASRAQLSDPSGVSVDGAGNLYIADRINRRIRKVDPASGIITTVAGTGTAGASPDGGAAITTNLPVAADVAADSSGNLYIVDSQRIRKVTAGGGGGPGGGTGPIPSITAIVDAAAYTANIAEGSVFVVKGKNLCDSGTVFGSVPYSSAPLNGVKITFTPVNGGAGTDAYMVYTYAAGATTQLAAILPSTVPARDYNVTVTNNGSVSAVFKATVVVHKFGIISVNGSGAGRAVVQNYISAAQYDLGRYTTGTIGGYTYSPAHPGQIIVIWGTGLGPIGISDNILPGAIDLRPSLNIQVLIDGVPVTPDLYAGRAPTLPGADEIVLTLPANVSTGCLLPLEISVNGQLSNSTTISIAAGSDGACTSPGITAAQLAKLDQGGTFNVGVLGVAGGVDITGTTNIRVDAASAVFISLNADQLNAGTPAQPPTTVPNNSCVVTRGIVGIPTGATNIPAFVFLGAGNVVLNGPNIANTPLGLETILNGRVNGVTVVNGAVLAAGTYTVTGAGGKDIGAFQASIALSQPLLVTSTVPNPILRSQDLTILWTGGGTDTVTITGGSSLAAPGSTPASPILDTGLFTCETTGDKGRFTIPASILQQLPAANGSVTVSSNNKTINFTAPNLDYGYFSTGFQNRFRTAYK